MKLTKKNLTKLLNKEARARVLGSMSKAKADTYGIEKYASFVIAEQLRTRDLTLKEDKGSFYGFSPLIAICAMLADGKMFSFMIEGNTVNHFLRANDVMAAAEVIKCVLISLVQSRKDIRDFDIKQIEAEMLKLRTQQAMHALAEEERKKRMQAELEQKKEEQQDDGSVKAQADVQEAV